MARLDPLFKLLKDQGGSDLHLAAGMQPHMRQHGGVKPIGGWPTFSDESLREHLKELANEKQWSHYGTNLDLDFAYALAGVGRFRANYFNQERGAAAVFRIIPEKIRSLEELKAPAALSALADLEQGLVLVTGPTGSGKSTTLAAIVDLINTKHSKHIVTIEDPVEFVHQNKKCTLSQREVGNDTRSFANALRSAIRQDPGVILVGEMRDMETIALAITAAEMGVLVFGTLHTNSAPKTIDRVIDAFPTDQQQQVRTMLSESLAAVVSQLLLRTPDGRGRMAVHEILLKTPGLPNVIREGNTPMIHSIIQSGKQLGMQAMDDVLFKLAEEGKISGEDAFHKASNKSRFDQFVKDLG
ncbi:MAG: type IV pilus twitching motility protein PilT [Myxococcales bacterium]|nr:type IV pilus twitching motility protein PilT [Myxococcales bacterium]MDP3505391.1 type IV pilus twitching motility protein PilT [Myxococcales bacterium]